jgi:hypothetical protein
MRARRLLFLLWVACGVLAAGPLTAQGALTGREKLAADRPEAWAMRWFAAALAPSDPGVAGSAPSGRVELGLDAAWLPSLSERQRTVGFGGTKVEDLNRSPVAPSLRARFGLPSRWQIDAGWTPPLEIDGARANLFSVGLSRALLERGPWRLGARLGGQTGRLEGDFTCPAATAAAGADPARNPYGCERASSDRVDLDQAEAGLGLAYRSPARPAWAIWLGGSVRRVRSSFRVHADWSGIRDRSQLEYAGNDWGLAAGVSWSTASRWSSAAELRWTPLDVTRPGAGSESDPLLQLRFSLAYRLR